MADDDYPFSLNPEEEEEEEHPTNIFSWASWPESFDLFSLMDPIPDAPPPAMPPLRSAFGEYSKVEAATAPFILGNSRNVHRRMLRFLSPTDAAVKQKKRAGKTVSSRRFRHLMKERERRERESQGYADLHSLLSSRSKGDKISIVESAREYLRELKSDVERLQRRNRELEEMLPGDKTAEAAAVIKLLMEDCSSPIGDMVAALECLKQMELKATRIKIGFLDQGLSMEIGVETQVAADEVEKAIKTTFAKEKKYGCYVENAS